MSLQATLTPGTSHGFNKKPPLFEGWYFILVGADESLKVAIIPVVILGEDAHAFVQVLDGVDGITTYHSRQFPPRKSNRLSSWKGGSPYHYEQTCVIG